MSSGDRYEAGQVSIEYNYGEPVITLPHQCDHWHIGSAAHARAMIADLQRAADAMERGDLQRCAHVMRSFLASVGEYPCGLMVIGSGRYCRDHEEAHTG